MDPDANLIEQRRLAADIVKLIDQGRHIDTDKLIRLADRLAELVQALDEWISGGGFLPAPWQKAAK